MVALRMEADAGSIAKIHLAADETRQASCFQVLEKFAISYIHISYTYVYIHLSIHYMYLHVVLCVDLYIYIHILHAS